MYVSNCHLHPDCSNIMETIITKLQTCQDINPNFRLWLTTMPNESMPDSVLGNCIKLAIEPSNLLRDQILENFTTTIIADPNYYNSYPTKAANFTKLIYSIVFLVCQSNGRHVYGNNGWSGKFFLTSTDVEIGLKFLAVIMKNHDGINFTALHFLLNECNIENRIKDEQDRQLLKMTMKQVLIFCKYKFDNNIKICACVYHFLCQCHLNVKIIIGIYHEHRILNFHLFRFVMKAY